MQIHKKPGSPKCRGEPRKVREVKVNDRKGIRNSRMSNASSQKF